MLKVFEDSSYFTKRKSFIAVAHTSCSFWLNLTVLPVIGAPPNENNQLNTFNTGHERVGWAFSMTGLPWLPTAIF